MDLKMIECLSVNFKFDVVMALAESKVDTRIHPPRYPDLSFICIPDREKPATEGTISGIMMLIGSKPQETLASKCTTQIGIRHFRDGVVTPSTRSSTSPIV